MFIRFVETHAPYDAIDAEEIRPPVIGPHDSACLRQTATMPLRILFCAHPLERTVPDPSYDEEVAATAQLGIAGRGRAGGASSKRTQRGVPG